MRVHFRGEEGMVGFAGKFAGRRAACGRVDARQGGLLQGLHGGSQVAVGALGQLRLGLPSNACAFQMGKDIVGPSPAHDRRGCCFGASPPQSHTYHTAYTHWRH